MPSRLSPVIEPSSGADERVDAVDAEVAPLDEEAAAAAVEAALARVFRRLDPWAFGLALGAVAGITLGAATLFLVAKGGHPVGPTLALLGQYFPGYRVSAGGSLLGLVYGFLTGFVGGWSFAALRNLGVLFVMRVIYRRAEREAFQRELLSL